MGALFITPTKSPPISYQHLSGLIAQAPADPITIDEIECQVSSLKKEPDYPTNYQKAYELYRKALWALSGTAQSRSQVAFKLWLGLAKLEIYFGHLEKTTYPLDAASQLNNSDPTVLYLRGALSQARKDWKSAEHLFRVALTLLPNSSYSSKDSNLLYRYITLSLADIFSSTNQFSVRLEILSALEKYYPDDPLVLFALASTLQRSPAHEWQAHWNTSKKLFQRISAHELLLARAESDYSAQQKLNWVRYFEGLIIHTAHEERTPGTSGQWFYNYSLIQQALRQVKPAQRAWVLQAFWEDKIQYNPVGVQAKPRLTTSPKDWGYNTGEIFPAPELTLQRRSGACDAAARFFYELLKPTYQTRIKIICFETLPRRFHVICAFSRGGGRWEGVDQATVITAQASNITDMLKKFDKAPFSGNYSEFKLKPSTQTPPR